MQAPDPRRWMKLFAFIVVMIAAVWLSIAPAFVFSHEIPPEIEAKCAEQGSCVLISKDELTRQLKEAADAAVRVYVDTPGGECWRRT